MVDTIETFLIIQFIVFAFGLKNVNIVIEPPVVERGKSVTIQCNYDLEGELLYIVKWYRGHREFYRYIPQSRPTTMKFPFNGLDIDKNQSNENEVHLRNVDYNLAGNFSCEVSTDAPAFYTSIASKELKVVEFSKNKRLPILVTDKPNYEEGDILNASCSSSPSNPPASIAFILNNIVICDPCNITVYKTEGLWLARSNLLLPLFPSHFNTDKLILQCVTHVTNRYQQETRIQIYSRPDPISQRGKKLWMFSQKDNSKENIRRNSSNELQNLSILKQILFKFLFQLEIAEKYQSLVLNKRVMYFDASLFTNNIKRYAVM